MPKWKVEIYVEIPSITIPVELWADDEPTAKDLARSLADGEVQAFLALKGYENDYVIDVDAYKIEEGRG